MFPLLTLLWAAPASAQDCAFQAPVADLNRAMDSAENAYADLDVDTFLGSMDELAMLLPCLSEPYSSETAARVHLFMGIRAFTEGDETKAEQALTAARRTDRFAPIPDALIPQGHPVRLMHDRVKGEPGATEPVAPPREGFLHFDGTQGTLRPTEQATLVQIFDGADKPVGGGYAYPGDKLPWYEAGAKPAALPVDKPPKEPKEGGGLSPLVPIGAAAVIAGGTAMFLANGKKAQFDGSEYNSVEDLDALYNSNQALGWTGVGLVLAGGAGVTIGFAL